MIWLPSCLLVAYVPPHSDDKVKSSGGGARRRRSLRASRHGRTVHGGAQSVGSLTDLWYPRGSRTTLSNSAKASRLLLFTCPTLGFGNLVATAPTLGTQLDKGTTPCLKQTGHACHWEEGVGRGHGGGSDHPLVASSPSIVDVDPTTRAPGRSVDEETRRPTSCHRASLTGLAVKLPPAAE